MKGSLYVNYHPVSFAGIIIMRLALLCHSLIVSYRPLVISGCFSNFTTSSDLNFAVICRFFSSEKPFPLYLVVAVIVVDCKTDPQTHLSSWGEHLKTCDGTKPSVSSSSAQHHTFFFLFTFFSFYFYCLHSHVTDHTDTYRFFSHTVSFSSLRWITKAELNGSSASNRKILVLLLLLTHLDLYTRTDLCLDGLFVSSLCFKDVHTLIFWGQT